MSEAEIREVESEIASQFVEYEKKHAELSSITTKIKELEEQRANLIDEEARVLAFIKPVIQLRDFTKYMKTQKWVEIAWEGFEDEGKVREDIVDEAMLVNVSCLQNNFLSPVRFIFSLAGYMSKSEYDLIRKKSATYLPEYYKEGEEDVR